MNWDRIEGKWKELRGNVRERWGKLTDDDLDRIAGKRDQLTGRLQERYGWTKDQIEREVRVFEESLSDTESSYAGTGSSRQADGAMSNTPRNEPSRGSSKEREPAGGSSKKPY